MVGEKQVAELSLRRCQRCGALLMADPGIFTRLLDLLIIAGADNFCQARSGANPPLFVCQGCLGTERQHFGSAARGKTK